MVMETLPQEMWEIILSWLPPKSLIRFKCVCKSWFHLIEDKVFIERHLLNNTKNKNNAIQCLSSKSIPFLSKTTKHGFAINNPDDDHNINDPIPCDSSSLNEMFNNNNELVLGSQCNGLVCLFDADSVVLCNPWINELRHLPPCLFPSSIATSSFGLGYDPKSKDYKIARIGLHDDKAELYTLSSNSWREIKLSDVRVQKYAACVSCMYWGRSCPLYFRGACYWLATNFIHVRDYPDVEYGMLSFDMCKEEFMCFPLPSTPAYYSKISVWNESVAAFSSFIHEESKIEMWVLDHPSCSWTKLAVIQFQSGIFLRPRLFLIWKRDELLMEIYDPNQIKLVSYNLATGKFRNFATEFFENNYMLKVLSLTPSLVSVKSKAL